MRMKNLALAHVSPAILAAAGVLFLASSASAQQVAANETDPLETVVVTGTAFNADTAPAKASLETAEPQTIINRSYVEDSISPTADYTTILAIAPSMTGVDLNGPGMSDGGVKNTLRGIPDGSFGMTYDGIPFGDSNGPSHHSESYFPATTIGSISVDRGPGNAGDMGASTYGGTVKMYSEVLGSDAHTKLQATGGSWATDDFNANYQTGDFDLGGVTNRALINFQDTNSGGYLSYQSTAHQNLLIKTQTEIAGWTATFFANYNGLFQTLNDNAGETAAQINTYGKAFALQTTNPNAGTFVGFDHVHKKTDMDYIRLQGDAGWGISIDNTTYTYAYVNKTQTSLTVAQTAADIAAGVTETNGTVVGGVKFASDVPGYTKQNAYRMWGDILRASKDFDFGWLTGQVRAGIWWEDFASQRSRADYDATKCLQADCNPWHNTSFADSRLDTGATPTSAPFMGGYYEYYEHSNWSEYQPFVELELHPVDGLTLTPGFKYVWWDHGVNAPLEQKTKPVSPLTATFTTTRDLPFFEANYKIEPSWSVYAQYAQGIYIPDISQAFEGAIQVLIPGTTRLAAPPKAQTTTNYQTGTVFYADNFTFDADIYYIGVENNLVSQDCRTVIPNFTQPGFTCQVNTGTATYKGIEGEGTYAFDGALDGLALFANGSLISGKSGTRADGRGAWLKNVPMWTSAAGLTYKTDWFKLSLIDKTVGQQYSDSTNTQFYKIRAYNTMDFKGTVTEGMWDFSLSLSNLLNDRSLAAVGIVDKTAIGGSSVYDIANRGGSQDTYSFLPSRGFQFSVAAHF